MNEKKQVYFLSFGVLRKGKVKVAQYQKIPKGFVTDKVLEKMIKNGEAGDLPKPTGNVNEEVKKLSKLYTETKNEVIKLEKRIEDMNKAGESLLEENKELEKMVTELEEEKQKFLEELKKGK